MQKPHDGAIRPNTKQTKQAPCLVPARLPIAVIGLLAVILARYRE